MKTITILGATGSIGTQTLDVIRRYRADFSIYALVAGTNVELMVKQVEEFRPKLVVMKDEEHAERLKSLLFDKCAKVDEPKSRTAQDGNSQQSSCISTETEIISNSNEYPQIDGMGNIADQDVRIIYGMDGYIEAVTADEVELVVAAMVGMIGLRPVIEAIRHGKDIALANKETLVCAGHIIMREAREHQVNLLPVDSEHSAIFQCLQGVKGHADRGSEDIHAERSVSKLIDSNVRALGKSGVIETIFLTASGGPFRGATREDLEGVSVEQALAHPNWSMGAKITTDSATMINKGLEIIEAMWLFGVDLDQIHVLVQPKSIIHSMVGFRDGAVLAQLGSPDMRVPIQYALMYPERRYLDDERLDFETLAQITFEKPNTDVLRGIPLAVESARIGGTMTTVMNAANEYAVEKFLQKKLPFLQIYGMIEYAMEQHTVIQDPSIEDILEAESWTYRLLDSYQFG